MMQSPVSNLSEACQKLTISLIAVTYGNAIGHIKAGRDIGGMLQMMKMVLMYTIYVMQAPALDRLLWKNPVLMWFNKHGLFNSHRNMSVTFALKNQDARRQLRESSKKDLDHKVVRPALMDRFLEAQEQNPDVIGPKELLALGISILGAGSDSTYFLPPCSFHSLTHFKVHALSVPSSGTFFRIQLVTRNYRKRSTALFRTHH